MIKQDFDVARLIAQYLSGEIAPEGEVKLDAWRKESDAHESLFQKLCSEENYKQHVNQQINVDIALGWSQLEKRIKKSKQRVGYFHVLRYASIILLPIVAVLLSINYTLIQRDTNKPLLGTTHILPGEAKAILTLADGQTVYLDKNTTSQKQVQLSENLIGVDSTTLNYRLAQKRTIQNTLIYNKVEIPCGGEYALVLNDGTKVRLNSMSSLRFPVVFGTGHREVELTGEAYFEVAKGTKPFIVRTKGMNVEVLGTSFNLSAYPDEECQATLVSGVVKVNSQKGQSLTLKPSQQASLSPQTGQIEVRTVDTAFYTSWVKGKIYFKDQRLEEIMKSLSRWYDIEVKYANEAVKELRFGCHVDRYSEITPFVELLEATKNVKITIQHKTIIFQ